MTYVWQGRQYVVIAAGGHGEAGAETSDAVVAFALPAPGEPTRTWWDRTIDQPGGHAQLGLALGCSCLAGFVAVFVRWRRTNKSRA
jgi:quinoprotein glucose dehydrogenase